MRDLEADGFVAKPLDEDMALVATEIREALVRAEREGHAACAPWLVRAEVYAPGREGLPWYRRRARRAAVT